MATLPRYRQDIVDNPVQRAERVHLLRVRMSYFWRGVYAITLFAMIMPILWGFNIFFQQTLEIALGVLVLLNILSIFVVEMGIINHAGDSIKREFQGKTWDLLILTGVDTWRMILGKWVGTIRGNRRDMVFLYVLRMITVFWGMVLYFLQQDGFHYHHGYKSSLNYAYLSNIHIDLEGFVMIALIMAFYIVLEIMLVASLPMAFSLFRFTRKSATWISLGLRIGIPIVFGFFIYAWHFDFPYRFGGVAWHSIHYSTEHHNFIGGLVSMLADNGYGLSALAAGQGYVNIDFSLYIVTQVIGIGLYVLWIWIMLRFAKFAAYRQNVSAPGFIPKGKPKRLIKAEQSTAVESSAPPVIQPKQRSPRETNLLGIQSPALYRCEVMHYEASQLEIAVYRMTESVPEFRIRFAGVSFFTGAMNWTNAKFERLEDKHLQQYATNQKLDYDKLPQESKLYVVQSQGNRTRIIATDVQVETFMPEPV